MSEMLKYLNRQISLSIGMLDEAKKSGDKKISSYWEGKRVAFNSVLSFYKLEKREKKLLNKDFEEENSHANK